MLKTEARKNIFSLSTPVPCLDLSKIGPGKILTVCFSFAGNCRNRIRVSFEITQPARPKFEEPAKGVISGFRSSPEIIEAFEELNIEMPSPETDCQIFGSCVKTEIGIKELTANLVIPGRYLYWATASLGGDQGWLFPDPIAMWLVH